ncbi:SEC14 family lipid-binding protein [Aspergillus candidus]|uniref:CRAL-TRIO domain-containing protein n=1 Tax=Aspergillus candidus TaxID=41067 RepID=A0A2I2EY23_ASPCN|nr:CRAL-TRIO domain-containing protein [Aspergillus candidus]PLB33275.1 CRAL-TRIO domain-containing protein [Aspergillus candidus]
MVNMNKKTLAGWQDSRFLPHSVEGEDQLQTLDLLQLASAIFDDITRFVFPLCSALQNPCQPIASAIILVDASNMNMMQGFDLRVFARDVSSLLTTCYPETIHKIFVCNTPSYFATIWKFLKGWVDPVTADKLIFLTPSEVLPTLEEHIDTASLPASLGGSHPWKHGERPLLDEPTKALLKVDELPPGPMKWVVDDQGRRCLVAVGSEGGKPRRETVAVLGDR